MPSKEIAIINLETEFELSLDELCEACHVSHEFIEALVEHGAIEPYGISIEVWRFHPQHIHRVLTVQRLQDDLEVNLPGAVLAVDLLEQIERMHKQLEVLEKYLESGH